MVQTTNQFSGGGPKKNVSTHRAVVQQLRLLLVPPDRFHRRRPGRIWIMRPIQQNPKPNLWITIVTKPLYVYHLSMCIYTCIYIYKYHQHSSIIQNRGFMSFFFTVMRFTSAFQACPICQGNSAWSLT